MVCKSSLGGICSLLRWSTLSLAMLAGCATEGPYRYGSREVYKTSTQLMSANEQQIEHGEERPILDSVGNIVGIPGKIMLWNRRVDNHAVSVDTKRN